MYSIPIKNIKGFLLICVIAILNSCEQKQTKGNEVINSKPNIVLLYADDQGTLDAGCYGINDIKTPNLDALAKKGIRFTQAYAHTVCCPSRAALLTGRAPQRSGVNQWTSCNPNDRDGRVMNLNEITIAEHLKQFDYKTALIGKWHLGATMDHGPLDQGFDYFYGFRGGFIDYYSHKFLHAKWQRPQFHDLYRNKEEIFEDGKYFPDLQINEAKAFIKNNKENPFFLYLPFNLPHYPEQPDPKFKDAYKDLKWPRSSYAPMISTIDDKMGEIFKTLENEGLTDNTIIIYMSDNGHSTEDYYNWDVSYGGNGGGGYTGKWRGAKGSFFEGGLRVPAVISYPKELPSGVTRDQAITNMDLLPTICDLLNVPKPKNKLDGKSVINILKNEEAVSPHKVLHWMWQDMWAVRQGNWKLIYNGHDTTGKFSNHPEKEFEMAEYYLAKLDDENPEEINYAQTELDIVSQLKDLHESWAKDVFNGSGYPDPNKIKVEEIKTQKGTTKL